MENIREQEIFNDFAHDVLHIFQKFHSLFDFFSYKPNFAPLKITAVFFLFQAMTTFTCHFGPQIFRVLVPPPAFCAPRDAFQSKSFVKFQPFLFFLSQRISSKHHTPSTIALSSWPLGVS